MDMQAGDYCVTLHPVSICDASFLIARQLTERCERGFTIRWSTPPCVLRNRGSTSTTQLVHRGTDKSQLMCLGSIAKGSR